MEYPKGLIRYTSEHELEGGKTRWIRPRIVGYTLVLLAMITIFMYTIFTRIPLDVTVERDRTQLYVKTEDGFIDNVYNLHVANMSRDALSFTVSIEGMGNAVLIGERNHTLNGGEIRYMSIRVRGAAEDIQRASTPFEFLIQSKGVQPVSARVETRFLGPTQ
ncbi:MAG: FixG Ig-like domain-containing protein, partial [Halioglobus sp.]